MCSRAGNGWSAMKRKEKLFNRLLTEPERAKYEHMRQRRKENEQSLRASLKGHLSTLNDGVMAIIITVMLLEIPFPTSSEGYGAFLWAILIFLVSFFVVAGFWYDNKRAFELIREVDHPVMIVNFLFLAIVSLIPVMTKWIMRETTAFSVLNYGIVHMAALLLGEILYMVIVRKRFQGHGGLLAKLMLSKMGLILAMNVALMLLGWFFPRPVVILYVMLPILRFLLPG